MLNQRQSFLYKLRLPILLVVLGVAGYAGFFLYQGFRSTYPEINDADVPRIKHPGLELGAYNPATKRAGDVIFTDGPMGQLDAPFIEFGYTIPANSVGPEKLNPQPTFVTVPNAKVYSLIDGAVVKVEQIYSGDYTIHVATSKFSRYIYETEHVVNPLVQVGDKVTAGQHIAQASNYDTNNVGGNGVVEFGILLLGKPYAHLCPYKYLDESIKSEVTSNLNSIYTAWNQFRKTNFYRLDLEYPGCVMIDKVYEEER